MTNTKDLEKAVIKALKELKAIDVVKLDVRHLTSITDTMIICTGTSSRHVKSIADKVQRHLSLEKVKPLGVEGENEGEWILIDFADVMVHILQQRTRDFYQLEKLWDIPKPKKKPSVKKGIAK
jgi:ribosome-associated protein